MRSAIDDIIDRAISPAHVKVTGPLTTPRSWGVYRLPTDCGATRRFRFGNHPVRMTELERDYGSCKLEHLFLHRGDAKALAELLNNR